MPPERTASGTLTAHKERQKTARAHRLPAELDALVITLIKASNRPLTAYDIVRLSRDGGSPLAPIQVYRVLDRLIAAGRLPRIELLSAYLPAWSQPLGFVVCRSCQAVEALPVAYLMGAVLSHCEGTGFKLSRTVTRYPAYARTAPLPGTGSDRANDANGVACPVSRLTAVGPIVSYQTERSTWFVRCEPISFMPTRRMTARRLR